VEEVEDWLEQHGRKLAKTRTTERKDLEAAEALTVEATAAGVPERRIAKLLGVDRMTVRKWVGKR
jgi:transposase